MIDTFKDDYPGLHEELIRMKKDYSWNEIVYYFRWVWNMLFWGIPWFFISTFIMFAQIVLNVIANKWWADGNIFLLIETAFLIYQTVLSWPLVMRLPDWL